MKLRTAFVLASLIAFASVSHAAGPPCTEPAPGEDWERVDPSAVGLDEEKLGEALAFATPRATLSLRVYRRGCLAGEGIADPFVAEETFESFSMAKSVTSMVVGRAWSMGLFSLDATIGGYFPEADDTHAPITLRQLLTMSSGLHWNFFRDYNLGMPDRVADALSLPVDRQPGAWFEYAQSPVALVAEMVTRAAGEDVQDFAQRELFGPIGIEPGSWTWTRDAAGNTVGFYGVHMRSRDFARLGHLMLRQGSWGGNALIDPQYVLEASSPSVPNPGYGYFFWLNGQTPVVAPTIYSRDVRHHWGIESAPADLYMTGFQEQRVYVIPSLDMVVVRLGYRGDLEGDTRVSVFTAAAGEFEHEFFRLLMRAVTDQTIQDPGPYPHSDPAPPVDPSYGILRSARETDDILAGMGIVRR